MLKEIKEFFAEKEDKRPKGQATIIDTEEKEELFHDHDSTS
jgi:hypothetical protein